MSRLSKTERAAILHAVDVEHRKVAEIAAEHGCTPANVYALLTRMRRDAKPTPGPAVPAPGGPVPADLFAAAPLPPTPPRPPQAPPRPAAVAALPPPDLSKGRKPSAGLAKPGVGLVMRTAGGEESTAPFRSLDDLLAAIRPILRSAARSPDAVWFSIQPVDLATLDSDAA